MCFKMSATGSGVSGPSTYGFSTQSSSPTLESDVVVYASSESESDEEGTEVVSLLDRLKFPMQADISRTRKIKKNGPPKGKQSCRGSLLSDPEGVIPSQWVKEFNEESLIVSHGRLFCSACRKEISLKQSIVKNHIQSQKHHKGKEQVKAKGKKESIIFENLKKTIYEEKLFPRNSRCIVRKLF